MNGDFIRFDEIRKSFGSNHVLRGVSLSVRRGETLVVLGGSGAGKSVLIRHIIGLVRPDHGRVIVDGEDVTDLPESSFAPVRRKVAMLFQGGALFDSMNVLDNVAFGLREQTRLPDEEIYSRVREKLALVELENVEHLMPSDLSGGMKKRVALARAIAVEPVAILYDEPTTGLDPITANTINDLIRNLQGALGVTSVVVTHDIQSAYKVGDRIAFLSEGVLCFVGSVDEARRSDEPRLRRFLNGGE
jgi:phospholipid/cholesterol/gamma-HCH transport system ATP-binding protein